MSGPLEVEAQQVVLAALERVSLGDLGVVGEPSVFTRLLDATDPNLSIGMAFMSWSPVDTPNIGSWGEPTIGRYVFAVQTFLKVVDRAEGEILSATLVKRVRQTLYRDPDLRSGLGALAEVDEDGTKERYLRHGITTSDYTDGSIQGGFAFLSQTEFFIETEVA